jgi:hypothetical protein
MVNSPYVVNKHQNIFIREMLFQQRHDESARRLMVAERRAAVDELAASQQSVR